MHVELVKLSTCELLYFVGIIIIVIFKLRRYVIQLHMKLGVTLISKIYVQYICSADMFHYNAQFYSLKFEANRNHDGNYVSFHSITTTD